MLACLFCLRIKTEKGGKEGKLTREKVSMGGRWRKLENKIVKRFGLVVLRNIQNRTESETGNFALVSRKCEFMMKC